MSASAEILSEWLRKIACSNSQERFKLLEAASEILRLTDELQECQAQRRAAFRRIEELDRELDAMRAQIGQGEPVAWMYDWMSDGDDVVRNWISRDYAEAHSPTIGCHNIRPLYTNPAPQSKPHTA